jgi:hypothetical protein
MLACSEGCGQWAQWRVSVAEKDATGKVVKFRTVALPCGRHKKTLEAAALKAEPSVDLRFNFVGAIPDGLNRS